MPTARATFVVASCAVLGGFVCSAVFAADRTPEPQISQPAQPLPGLRPGAHLGSRFGLAGEWAAAGGYAPSERQRGGLAGRAEPHREPSATQSDACD
jgi:hypothetical protein